MRVALIGAGRMGSAMGGRIARGGSRVLLSSTALARALRRSPNGSVAGWRRRPARPPQSAEVCVVSLADDAAVTATYLADDGLVVGVQPGAVVCDTSTVAPATVRSLAPLVAQQGATLLDTPVSGSVSTVESGTLTVMVGGDETALDHARPVLDAFAKSIFHLGDVGAGATMKLVVNSLVHSLNVAVSEALVLAEKAGLDREIVYDIFESGAAGAPFVKYKRAAFLRAGRGPGCVQPRACRQGPGAHPRSGAANGNANGPGRGIAPAGWGSSRGRAGVNATLARSPRSCATRNA